MIIEMLVNAKIDSDKVWFKGHRYEDNEQPFPEKIYEEIDRTQKGLVKKSKLRILDSTPGSSSPKIENEEIVTTLDDDQDALDTSEKEKPKRRRKK